MKDENFYVIQGWMVTKLNLKSAERDVFAIIYGYSQDGDSDYHGSLKYLAEMTGYSRNTICTALKNLTDKDLLIKTESEVNNIKFCKYKANLYTIQKICTPVQTTCTNNIYNNSSIVSSKDDTIHSEEQKSDFVFGKQKTKKSLYQKCADLIYEFTDFPSISNLLFQYLDLCMEMKSIRGANQWKGMLNTLDKVQVQCHPHTYEEIIQQSINRGWKTFYPINDNYSSKGNIDNITGMNNSVSNSYADENQDFIEGVEY